MRNRHFKTVNVILPNRCESLFSHLFRMGPKKNKCNKCKAEGADYTICGSCNKSCDINSVIIDNVLAYISTYIQRSSLIQLKLAVLGFFSESDISNAKQALYEKIPDLELEVSNILRHNSSSRTAKEAELDDVINIFQKIDQSSEINIPRILVEDITKLPPAAPEAGGCIMTLMESMAKMQRDLQQVQDSLGTIRTDVISHDEVIKDLQLNRKSPTSYANVTSASLPVLGNNRPAAIHVYSTSEPSTSQASSAAVNTKMVEDAIHQVRSGAPGAAGTQKHEVKAATNKPRLQPRGTAGTAKDIMSLKAGPQVFHVQLTNVHPDVSAEDLKSYISEKDTSINIVELKDMSSEGWETKRFVVTLQSSAYDSVMCPDFWPSKIYYKQWFKARPKPTQ